MFHPSRSAPMLLCLIRILVAIFVIVSPLVGCIYYPREVAGVPDTAPWFALPLRGWLAEGRVEPEAIAVCLPPDCSPHLAVGVFRIGGEDAQNLVRLLREPEAVAQDLQARAAEKARTGGKPAPARPSARTEIAVRPWRDGIFDGFVVSLARADAAKPSAYGAVLGRRDGVALRVVIAIGDEAEAVEAVARRVAGEHLGP